jgi:hypothetical protein
MSLIGNLKQKFGLQRRHSASSVLNHGESRVRARPDNGLCSIAEPIGPEEINAALYTYKTSQQLLRSTSHTMETVREVPSGEWWRKSLALPVYDVSTNLSYRPGSLKTIAMLSRSPRYHTEESIRAWVDEKKKVSLQDFLMESPADYGQHASSSTPRRPAIHIDPVLAYHTIREKEAEAVFADLSKLLLSQIGTKSFLKFLMDNLSAENLLFYLSVEELKTFAQLGEASSSMCLNGVRKIYDQYIKHNAPSMINIAGDKHVKISQELSLMGEDAINVSPQLFEVIFQAQEEIFLLMERDLFPRFLRSEVSDTWKTECRNAADELSNRSSLLKKNHSLPNFG